MTDAQTLTDASHVRGTAGLPETVVPYRRTPVFTEDSIPAALLRVHRTKPGVWGLIEVLEGQLLYRVLVPKSERVLVPGAAPGVVEPAVPHEVEPLGPVRFHVTFYRLPEAESQPTMNGGQPCRT